MWKRVVLVLLVVIFGLPMLAVLLLDAGDSGLGLLALLAVAAVYVHQRHQLSALRTRLDAELAELRQRVAEVRYARQGEAVESAAAESAEQSVSAVAPPATETVVPESTPALPAEATAAEPTVVEPTFVAAPMAPAETAAKRSPGQAIALEVDEWSTRVTASATASLAAWFKGGNTIVRVAVLVLFVGVAFLLRYAVEHDMLPIELRLAAVAAGGVALLIVGWRLRHRRRGYGLTLQGAGVGVLYMTLYAAMRPYELLPPTMTLALMMAAAGLAAALALGQNALPMAVVGFLGGFAAPLLTAGDAGNPVLLFGYCLVLNLAITWIAGRKAWKLLNLVGFTATSGVALLWGAAAWQPDMLASTEPFLLLHLALYLCITVRYSRQLAATPLPESLEPGEPAARPVPYVDSALMFGVPLVAAGFQAALVRHVPYALAASAALMSGIYLLLGRWLWRQAGERLRLLTEGMLALGAVFLTLVAPLALDPRWTAAAWAVQGAGMVWLALRQRRPWVLYFGLALQPLAAASFWSRPLPDAGALFLANAMTTGVVLMAVSALVCARLLQRSSANPQPESPQGPVGAPNPGSLHALHWAALALAVLHLLAGGWQELGRAPWSVPDFEQSWILWAVVLAVGLEAAHRRLAWPELAVPARPVLGVAGLLSLLGAATAVSAGAGWSRLWPAGLVEVAALAGAAGWVLWRLDNLPAPDTMVRRRLAGEAPAVVWYAMLHAALAVCAVAVAFLDDHQGWLSGGVIVAPTLLAWLVLSRLDRRLWPMNRDEALWITALVLPWLAVQVVWSAWVNWAGDGSMRPLPYLPLLNPVDLGHGLVLLFALRLRRSVQAVPESASGLAGLHPQLAAVAAAVAFWWLTGVLVRSMHQFAGTPLWGNGTLDSGLVQTGLSILWTLIALATMFVATRRKHTDHARVAWLTGGVLLAVVVAKLMLVDLSQTSALQRIVSFVGVGLLMLVVGYVAPIPPQNGPKSARPAP